MLMTGRYSLKDSKERNIEVNREPHLGSMFKKAGYTTSIFGKTQPLRTQVVNYDQSVIKARYKKMMDWRSTWKNKEDYHAASDEKKLFHTPGDYYQRISELDHSYDYSFSSYSPCCQVNGYFENGQQTEPFTEWAIQRSFPEVSKSPLMPCAYVAAPFMQEETQGDRFTANFPRAMVAQASFDSREKEQTVSGKLNDFIRTQKESDTPFFAYYGLREGHGPLDCSSAQNSALCDDPPKAFEWRLATTCAVFAHPFERTVSALVICTGDGCAWHDPNIVHRL